MLDQDDLRRIKITIRHRVRELQKDIIATENVDLIAINKKLIREYEHTYFQIVEMGVNYGKKH